MMETTNNETILDIIYKIKDDVDYSNEDNIIVIYFKQDHIIQKILRTLGVRIPKYKRIELDKFGSFVFEQIDGKNTIEDIARNLEEEFKDEIKPVYERLLLYLNHLEVNEKIIEQIINID